MRIGTRPAAVETFPRGFLLAGNVCYPPTRSNSVRYAPMGLSRRPKHPARWGRACPFWRHQTSVTQHFDHRCARTPSSFTWWRPPYSERVNPRKFREITPKKKTKSLVSRGNERSLDARHSLKNKAHSRREATKEKLGQSSASTKTRFRWIVPLRVARALAAIDRDNRSCNSIGDRSSPAATAMPVDGFVNH